MIRVIKAIISAIGFVFATAVFADVACEKHEKTCDDFLKCSQIDADKILSDSKKLYLKVREFAKGDKRAALDRNY